MNQIYNKLLNYLFNTNKNVKKHNSDLKDISILFINSDFFNYGIVELIDLLLKNQNEIEKNPNTKLEGLRIFDDENYFIKKESIFLLQKFKMFELIDNKDIEKIIENAMSKNYIIDKHRIWKYIIKNKNINNLMIGSNNYY